MKLDSILNSTDDIYLPTVIDSLLAKYNISLKKRFGQNFLIKKSIAIEIVNQIDCADNEWIIEIGPGLGALTFILSSRFRKVFAVEIDRGLYRILSDIVKYFNISNIELLNENIFRPSSKLRDILNRSTGIISNFPYSTGQKMIIDLLENYSGIKKIVGTLQKEVASRMIATPGRKEYGFISVWSQYLSSITIIRAGLAPGNFYPMPEVLSSIIAIEKKDLKNKNIEIIKTFLKCCFKSKRKSLVNNLVECNLFKKISKDMIKEIVVNSFQNEKIRAEDLSVDQFLYLLKNIYRV